jgi:hypothetical protein
VTLAGPAREHSVKRAIVAVLIDEHWWTERIRSAFSFGVVNVDNRHPDRRRPARDAALLHQPHLVAEFLWGIRINRDRRSGRATQGQIGATFRF